MPTVIRSLLIVATLLLPPLLLGACAAGDEASDVSVEPSEEATEGPVADAESAGPTPADDAATGSEGDEEPADESTDPRFPLTGTLELVEVEGGCLVLDVDGEQYEVLADPDSDLAIDAGNGVIVDSTGNELASAGDEVTVEGTVDPGMATFCQVGTPLFVSQITAR